MRKKKITTINRSTPQSYYHRPEWDDAEFGTELSGDTIQKLAWSGLRDRSNAELTNFLHYLMWVLSTRHKGRFSFATDACEWTFDGDRFNNCFTFEVNVTRERQHVAYFYANADIDGRMTWSFTICMSDDVDDVDLTEEFDLSAPSDWNRVTERVSESIAIMMRMQRTKSASPKH
jgi:hypothetical protein